MPFHILLPVIGVGVIQGLEQAITKNKTSCTVGILQISSSTTLGLRQLSGCKISSLSCRPPSHTDKSKACMVKLNRVHAREYSRCRANDFWIDSGSFGSLDWSLWLGVNVFKHGIHYMRSRRTKAQMLTNCLLKFVKRKHAKTTNIICVPLATCRQQSVYYNMEPR